MIRGIQSKEQRGITLIALVVTIIVLIVLAGIAISMTVGDNGIFAKAKEAKRLQITAEAKEKIGTEILDAQIEATQKDETLQQSKVEEIIAKYGELQADGDTIKLKDNGYEISLKEIYNGTTSSSGDSTGGSTDSAELDSLKAELAQTNATEDKILKNYKAYSNGKLMTGTMENYEGQTQEVASTSDDTYTYLSIPNAGYYGTDSKLKTLNSNSGGKITFVMSNYIANHTESCWTDATNTFNVDKKYKQLKLSNFTGDGVIKYKLDGSDYITVTKNALVNIDIINVSSISIMLSVGTKNTTSTVTIEIS